MVKEMKQIAKECFKNPKTFSVWVPARNKYLCIESEEFKENVGVISPEMKEDKKHPPINKEFKLVFLTAAIGTFIFILLCLLMTLLAGKEPHPLFEKVLTGFFDLAKIGFGAVVGLLGGKKLQADAQP